MNQIDPVYLVTGDPVAETSAVIPVLLVIATLACIAVAFVWIRRGRQAHDDSDRVFLVVAKRLGLRGADRALVHRFADHLQCRPVAILLSRDAWRRAKETDERATPPSTRETARIGRVERQCGFTSASVH